MKFLKKLHNLSIHALNLSAILAQAALVLNVGSAACMYLLDREKSKPQE